MSPNFTLILFVNVVFALAVIGFIRWRFGRADALSFMILSGGFTAIMDFISSFIVSNYCGLQKIGPR